MTPILLLEDGLDPTELPVFPTVLGDEQVPVLLKHLLGVFGSFLVQTNPVMLLDGPY